MPADSLRGYPDGWPFLFFDGYALLAAGWECVMPLLIFANGDLDGTDWVQPYFDAASTVIAADGGTRHLLDMGRNPNIVIGDLDSFPRAQRAHLEASGVRFDEYPPAKDETDLELALLFAARNFEQQILIFGGFGGRLDQLLANVLLLIHPELRNRSVRFVTEYQQTWLLQDGEVIDGEIGDTVSLIPLGGDVHVIRSSGLEWQLIDEILEFGPARGISNRLVAQRATVAIDTGYLLCVHTRRVWQR
jgi:thiamine pyrophosphokinase